MSSVRIWRVCTIQMIPLLLTTTLAMAQFNASNIVELPVSRFPEPKCTYNVRHEGPNGPLVTGRVNIGDPLYHQWQCGYGAPAHNAADIYCMMVHSCTVSSAHQPQPVEIIDEFGCTLFPQVISSIRYAQDLNAGLQVQAFSLDVDEPAISFRCSIKLLLKLNGICRRPRCAIETPVWRHRRAAFEILRQLI